MRIEALERDVLVFYGDTYQSVATAFLHNGRALLVDALASEADAQAMRLHLEDNLGARVQIIVMTHYMSDHMAALRVFPHARILAHQQYMHTFLSQQARTAADDAAFVAPTVTFTGTLRFDWGGRALELFHNPGKTMCAAAIDVPDCDLILCGDAIVGRTVYLSSSAPESIDEALVQLRRRQRKRIVPGHIGVLEGRAFDDARHYLRRLRECVMEARHAGADGAAIGRIRIEDCLSTDIQPDAFEREWHGRNLDRIRERHLFARGAPPLRAAS